MFENLLLVRSIIHGTRIRNGQRDGWRQCIWAGAKHILGTLTNVLFNNMQCSSVSSMIIVILMFNNNAPQGQHEGAWNDSQMNGNIMITGVSGDTYAGA